MDKYEVIGLIGEGSFGRVYKAKRNADSEIVAIKVIRKRGRLHKELKGLRRECEIQQHLHHPNIIQMLDSFETDNEIVVVTEFAHKELHVILGTEGFLSEDRVRVIVWDLVSALYYLHSHRVLHRDLKPQNILLDVHGKAKLCDFGFARNMSSGTYVLTSIKGTPLYMAPELIDERPYDHTADLWSLGCIIYELLVGAPPFCTTSLLHLVSLIRHEQVQWPEFISPTCTSFLKGLLQKDPSHRLSWPEILAHPFVAGHILILEGDHEKNISFKRISPSSSVSAKDKQKNNYAIKNTLKQRGHSKDIEKESDIENGNHNSVNACDNSSKNVESRTAQSLSNWKTMKSELKNTSNVVAKSDGAKIPPNNNNTVIKKTVSTETSPYITNLPSQRDTHLNKLSQNLDNFSKKINQTDHQKNDDKCKTSREDGTSTNMVEFDSKLSNVDLGQTFTEHKVAILTQNSKKTNEKDENKRDNDNEENDKDINKTPTKINTLSNWEICDIQQPIECEEWLAFLQKSMREIISNEVASLVQPNLANVIITPLRNPTASSRVIENVANLLALPFVVDGTTDENLQKIIKVYLEIKVVPNLIYAAQLITRIRQVESSGSSDTPTNLSQSNSFQEMYRSMSDLSVDELQSLESIFVLICNLVYRDVLFASQFCDAVVILNVISMLRNFLTLSKRKLRIVTDIIAILTRILQILPENAELVEQIIFSNTGDQKDKFIKRNDCKIDLVTLLRHSNSILRMRMCILLHLLGRYSSRALQLNWNARIRDTLEDLMYDSIESVRNAAEASIMLLQRLVFYNFNGSSTTDYSDKIWTQPVEFVGGD